MHHSLTLCTTPSTFQYAFSASMPTYVRNCSLRPCVPDLNLNKSPVPASLTPCKYFLNSKFLPNVLIIKSLFYVRTFPPIHSSTQDMNEANELSSLSISCNKVTFIHTYPIYIINHLTLGLPLPTRTWFYIPLLTEYLFRVPIPHSPTDPSLPQPRPQALPLCNHSTFDSLKLRERTGRAWYAKSHEYYVIVRVLKAKKLSAATASHGPINDCSGSL